MLIKTLAPLEITIGAASIEIAAYAVIDVPPSIAFSLRQAGHATDELETAPLPSALPVAPVTITDLDADEASERGGFVRIAVNRFVLASTHAIGTPADLANLRAVYRINELCAWVPATVAEAIVTAGAGQRVPWFVQTSADAGITFDPTAAPLEPWAEAAPTDRLRQRLGNSPDATLHPWTAA
ncbi:MAG: hypothetical protein VR78_11005 [Hoeflea sp. BRH_c9]|nr:MAG: hypothetical protein VR78_11005 [Hoeflea sp. BRH_c9]